MILRHTLRDMPLQAEFAIWPLLLALCSTVAFICKGKSVKVAQTSLTWVLPRFGDLNSEHRCHQNICPVPLRKELSVFTSCAVGL